MVANIEELEILDVSEIHARKLNAKEVLTPHGVGSIRGVLSRASLSSIFSGLLRSRCIFSLPCHCRTATHCHRDAPCQKKKSYSQSQLVQ